MYIFRIIFFFILSLGAFSVQAQQSGSESESFNFDYYSRFDNGLGTDQANTYASCPLPNGQILVGGYFSSYNGNPVFGLVLLNSDGSVDHSFHSGFVSSSPSIVKAIEVQADGKIWIGGQFDAYDGVNCKGIVRLNPNGTIDPAYSSPGITTGDYVNDIVLLSSGKIMIGGVFTAINSVSRKNIAQLNADGSIDFSFDPGNLVSSGEVMCMVEHPSGGVVVGGWFTNCIIKLTVSGANDTSMGFGGCIGTDAFVANIELTPFNQFIFSGHFYASSGMSIQNVVRVGLTGTGDPSFNYPNSPSSSIWCSKTLNDGTVLLGGDHFPSSNGDGTYSTVIKLNSDGSTYPLTENIGGSTGIVRSIRETINGDLMVVGTFNYFEKHFKGTTALIDNNGHLIESFGSPTCTNRPQEGNGFFYTAYVNTISKYTDSRLIVGGAFSEYNGKLSNSLVRLFPDGTLDTTFNAHFNKNDIVFHTATQADGKILVSGKFVNGNYFTTKLIRIDSTGQYDSTFTSALSVNKHVSFIHIRPSGKILIAGEHVIGVEKAVIQLNTDGSIDPAFNTFSPSSSDHAYKIIELPSGKLYVAGQTSEVARLNANGTVDASFNGFDYNSSTSINGFAMQSDGKLLVSGPMSSENHNLIRLNTNGTLDNTFDYSYIPTQSDFGTVAVQGDGKIIVASDMFVFRLLGNGHYDPTFSPVSIFGSAYCLYIDSGRFILGGNIDKVNNHPRCDLTGIVSELCTSTSEYVSDSFCEGTTYSFGGQVLTAAGTYTHTYSSSGGCDSTVVLTLTQNDTSTIAIVAVNAEITGNDGSIDVQITNPNEYSFLWSNGSTTEDLSGIVNGMYILSVTNNLTGCVSTITVTVGPLAFGENEIPGLNAFPNPSKGQFELRSDNYDVIQINLVDGAGREILSYHDLETKSIAFNTLDFAPGVYRLEVRTAFGWQSLRIVIW